MLKHLIEDEVLLLRHQSRTSRFNLLGQKRKGISKVHISYILRLKKNSTSTEMANYPCQIESVAD